MKMPSESLEALRIINMKKWCQVLVVFGEFSAHGHKGFYKLETCNVFGFARIIKSLNEL